MAGQSLGYAGLTGGLPFNARTNPNDHNGLPCFAAPLPSYGDRHRRPRDVSAAISGSAAPKTTVLKQQIPPPVFQAEDSALSDTVPEEPNDAAASEDSVICTFRWPAALPGQEVGVVGACDPSCLTLNSLSMRNLPLILRAWGSYWALPRGFAMMQDPSQTGKIPLLYEEAQRTTTLYARSPCNLALIR